MRQVKIHQKNTRQIVKHVKIPFTSIENADVIWTLRTV